jgi:hypothetical protein
MNPVTRHKVENNLFPAARRAVACWDKFPWHPNASHCDAWKLHSSQALAIDIFGTIQCSPQRDIVLDAMAAYLRLPGGGPWKVCLEWLDPNNGLRERRPTQVDAVAEGRECLIFFECKFMEEPGHCSQVPTGQCNGNYAMQFNPRNGKRDLCSLKGKGIRYWEVIPKVFDYRNESDHKPCPFQGPWFQWMRNLTLVWDVAKRKGKRPAFVIAYADGDFPMARTIKSSRWQQGCERVRPDAVKFGTMPIQEVLALARNAAQGNPAWAELSGWVACKIEHAAARAALRDPPADESGHSLRDPAGQRG